LGAWILNVSYDTISTCSPRGDRKLDRDCAASSREHSHSASTRRRPRKNLRASASQLPTSEVGQQMTARRARGVHPRRGGPSLSMVQRSVRAWRVLPRPICFFVFLFFLRESFGVF